MRTTIDLDSPVLQDLKRRQKKEGKTLSRVVNELLAAAFRQRTGAPPKKRLKWPAKLMGQRIDIDDREALWALLTDEEAPG